MNPLTIIFESRHQLLLLTLLTDLCERENASQYKVRPNIYGNLGAHLLINVSQRVISQCYDHLRNFLIGAGDRRTLGVSKIFTTYIINNTKYKRSIEYY